MDICEMADCQYFLFRDPNTKDGLAIIEIPKTNGVFNNQFIELDEIVGLSLTKSLSTATWNAWLNKVGRKIIVLTFIWQDSPAAGYVSGAFKYFIGSRYEGTLPLECISEAEARTVLVIGQLDYFQAVEVNATDKEITNDRVEYVGKIDPKG